MLKDKNAAAATGIAGGGVTSNPNSSADYHITDHRRAVVEASATGRNGSASRQQPDLLSPRRISERKRRKRIGRGGCAPFLQLLNRIIDSSQWAAMPGSAQKLLIDLAREYRGPNTNNGNISFDDIRKHNPTKWRSRATRQFAVNYLIDHGWITRTKHGGLHMGPDLFAITWWPIDECGGRHDYHPEKAASNLWAKEND